MSSQNTKDSHNSAQAPQATARAFNANNAVDASDTDNDASTASPKRTPPSSRPSKASPTPTKANAFEKLMSASASASASAITTASASPSSTHSSRKRLKLDPEASSHLTRPGRNGLGAYLTSPSTLDPSVLVYANDSVVVIRDRYPKASVHLLILPRTPRNTLHPFVAFQDVELLASTRVEVERVKVLVAEELRRMFGRGSAAERARREAIVAGEGNEDGNGDRAGDGDGGVPPGRQWVDEVIAGVHAGPSMNHLHVHVLSRDMVSECMRHRKHYNSFQTDFFVPLEELPLSETDKRWKSDRGGGLGRELKCWRCGRGFGNKFEKLKRHLAEEFEEWKML